MKIELNNAVGGGEAAGRVGDKTMSDNDQAFGRFSTVPAAWDGMRLYDWGQAGLRSQGNCWVRAEGRRPRKSFDFHVGTCEFEVLPCGGDRKFLYRVKAIAGSEMWPVYERAGKFWARRYYLVPAMAMRMAREQEAAQAAVA